MPQPSFTVLLDGTAKAGNMLAAPSPFSLRRFPVQWSIQYIFIPSCNRYHCMLPFLSKLSIFIKPVLYMCMYYYTNKHTHIHTHTHTHTHAHTCHAHMQTNTSTHLHTHAHSLLGVTTLSSCVVRSSKDIRKHFHSHAFVCIYVCVM